MYLGSSSRISREKLRSTSHREDQWQDSERILRKYNPVLFQDRAVKRFISEWTKNSEV